MGGTVNPLATLSGVQIPLCPPFKLKISKKRTLEFPEFVVRFFCPGGEIGIHVGLRSQCLIAWEFESLSGHHFKPNIFILYFCFVLRRTN